MRLLLLLMLGLSLPAHAASSDAFEATCVADGGYGYRASTDILGKPLEPKWADEGAFASGWTFRFDGNDQVLINGTPGVILAAFPGALLIAERPAATPSAASFWTYAINLNLRHVVAAQVNVHGGEGSKMQGVKTRAVSLKCDLKTL